MEHSIHIQKFGKVDFFGQPCMRTLRNLFRDVQHVRNMATSIQEIPCHWLTISKLNSLAVGELIT